MKKHPVKTFIPISAVAAVFGLAASGANADIPIFGANFPASWNGTGTTVIDQSGAGNIGFQSGTTHATYTTATVPPGALAGTGSMQLDGAAGIKVTPTKLLNNTAIGNAGGFIYNINFLWDGTDSSAAFGGVEKLIDYAGTESLQLVVPSGGGSAALQMTFTDDLGATAPVVGASILPGTWYDVTLRFDNTVVTGGDVTGTASLYVDGGLVDSAVATKGTYGDSLNRPIGIGEFGYGHSTSIIGLHGDIYGASIQLVPEPSMLALGALGGLGMLFRTRRKS
jgi:PEP-CTERM motif-containing protein